MSSLRKTNKNGSVRNDGPLQTTELTISSALLSPALQSVKSLTDKGEYERALNLLSKYTNDPEMLNCRGVCLLRLHRFYDSIGPFRMAALNTGTMQVHENLPTHIKINFAIALFFGGYPSGALDTLSEFKHSENDPDVLMLHRQAKLWEQNMSPLRRFYWRLTRIAPTKGPSPPNEPVGRFVWDLTENQ